MKTSELKAGEMYECILSGNKMLIVETQKQTGEEEQKIKGGKTIKVPTFETVKAGKLCFVKDGVPNFMFNELHDGQMKKIKD